MKSIFIYSILVLAFCVVVSAQTGNKNSPKSEETICCGSPWVADEYGKQSFRDEMARLSGLTFWLNENPNLTVYFIITLAPKDTYLSTRNRVNKISKYLTQTQKISSKRINFVFSEYETQRTTIYLLPPEAVNNFPGGVKNLELLRPQNRSISKNSKEN